jgi:predicted nucleic acid-binding protein
MISEVFVDTNYWDAAILAAVRRLGCHTAYSEDSSDGQNYDGVMFVNPFKEMTP